MGATQLAWSIGPTITFILAVFLVPLGLFGSGLPWHRTRKREIEKERYGILETEEKVTNI
ncbi:hypothetical protein NSS70_08525 [Aeribacillus sp. FSL K6-2848]|mgnify:CR=1 FL=1|uniref:hypothetical protein n=1 Tax=unclassified Aeribacillus TaxID=2640495 RepID=UPI0030F8CCBA